MDATTPVPRQVGLGCTMELGKHGPVREQSSKQHPCGSCCNSWAGSEFPDLMEEQVGLPGSLS